MSDIKYLITDSRENAIDVVTGKVGVQQMIEQHIQDTNVPDLVCFEDFRVFELGQKWLPIFSMTLMED